jgi:hypothetical protein
MSTISPRSSQAAQRPLLRWDCRSGVARRFELDTDPGGLVDVPEAEFEVQGELASERETIHAALEAIFCACAPQRSDAHVIAGGALDGPDPTDVRHRA